MIFRNHEIACVWFNILKKYVEIIVFQTCRKTSGFDDF